MGEIVHKVLWFDRFALNLTRGCLQSDGRDIDLRPKAFEVLRHLAVNAGALVSKRDLYEAVWPNVSVSDDSLVQCIRELRQKLGDHEHRLIKTVSRRGYMLDARLRTPANHSVASQGNPRRTFAAMLVALRDATHGKPWRALAAVAFLGCAGTAGVYLLVSSAKSLAKHSAASIAVHQSTFRDCDVCPEMVPLPRGDFTMGSPEDEVGRRQTEGTPRRITIAKRFALGRFEVTVDEFSAFVSEAGVAPSNACHVIVQFGGDKEVWGPPQAAFLQPGFEITGSHPVVCVSGHEAQSYVAWLRRRTGKAYRLPTEAEWEYAARAGTVTSYSFGMDETLLCAYARFADLASAFAWNSACRSTAVAYGPLRVGLLKPNPWGLYDVHGNAWEWVEDCWTPDARKIPLDGSAFVQPGGCEVGVIRGGSFASAPGSVRSAHRRPVPVAKHYQTVGLRVALTLDTP